ncbi:MAG: hypothetical protein JXD19_05245 [Deltaproteobacteria bacterium]|nr:hypothetical protein [Deltaproteobacteria bacterium]
MNVKRFLFWGGNSGVAIVLIVRGARDLPIFSTDMYLGIAFWLIGCAMAFTETAASLAGRFWWLGGAYHWFLYSGAKGRDREASIRDGTLFIGWLFIIVSWLLMTKDFWRS